MAKLAVVGQNTARLIDCSEAVPVPQIAVTKPATYVYFTCISFLIFISSQSFPAGQTRADLQQACPLPFPALKTDGELYAHSWLA